MADIDLYPFLVPCSCWVLWRGWDSSFIGVHDVGMFSSQIQYDESVRKSLVLAAISILSTQLNAFDAEVFCTESFSPVTVT
jgi:hypothetical protein